MGMSGAFLAELDAQRSAALLELQAAHAAADESLAIAALARLRDLDELLNRRYQKRKFHECGR